MLVFEDVSKTYHAHRHEKQVFNNINCTIRRGDAVGVVGANGAGKSTMMRLMAGVEAPTTGRVTRYGSTSWPLGYGSVFNGALTGADNTRFIARIYGQDEDEMIDKVQSFAQLGRYFHEPVMTYSSGMGARLAFGISLTIEFDIYLIDEVTSAGDERFRRKSEQALMERRERGTLIMISHDPAALRAYCDRGAVLYGGSLTFFDTVTEACEVHYSLQTLG
ncbi:ABC transporter ATP-binding protein [Sphingomonas sp. R86521]|uniref:ABC transporter ATP-binding protein n=1 Tax=Sphingomonas sp. R86521 TaxID=3093860 RepID=UPI0036D29D49